MAHDVVIYNQKEGDNSQQKGSKDYEEERQSAEGN